MGELPDGRKVFVWNALPGEEVTVQTTKLKKDYAEGLAVKIISPSPDRTEPKDDLYLSTSPWQMMTYGAENKHKQEILAEIYQRESVEYNSELKFIAPEHQWRYRNKMEYSFWGDDDGLHLALYNRGTHHKQIVQGSSIARPEIDEVAGRVCAALDQNKVRAGDLKSLILRCDNDGNVVCALFVKDSDFSDIPELYKVCQGVVIVYSNPKSPASVRTKDLYTYGDIILTGRVNNVAIKYDVFSFFQVNTDIFNQAMTAINKVASDLPVTDMYSGVGTIGLGTDNPKLLVELDESNIKYATVNAAGRDVKVIHAPSEKALEYIDSDSVVICDPPRAGLHKDLVNKLLEVRPPKIIYLSCNPSTQVRDLKFLQGEYKIDSIVGYNFFPRTPHIESLAILVRQ